jgi:hypothetical protein
MVLIIEKNLRFYIPVKGLINDFETHSDRCEFC